MRFMIPLPPNRVVRQPEQHVIGLPTDLSNLYGAKESLVHSINPILGLENLVFEERGQEVRDGSIRSTLPVGFSGRTVGRQCLVSRHGLRFVSALNGINK